MIDLDGHRATDPRDAGYAQAVTSARAAVAAAKKSLATASADYLGAIFAAAIAKAQRFDAYVSFLCGDGDYKEIWRTDRLPPSTGRRYPARRQDPQAQVEWVSLGPR